MADGESVSDAARSRRVYLGWYAGGLGMIGAGTRCGYSHK